MTPSQADVLDELHFPCTFIELQHQTNLPKERLTQTLGSLLQKGWIKCFDNFQEEPVLQPDWQNPKSYKFNATKEGLLAHYRG